jgi:hypothetical protein
MVDYAGAIRRATLAAARHGLEKGLGQKRPAHRC